MLVRALTPMIGFFLFLSAFMWPHSMVQATNAKVCGVLVVILSTVGLFDRRWSYGAALVGLWLAASSVFIYFLSSARPTSWTEVPLGVLIIATTIAPRSLRHPPVQQDVLAPKR